MEIKLKPIGVIHSPYEQPADIPRPKGYDPHKFDTTRGEIEVFTDYQEGLKDIEGFSHLIVLFAFHKSDKTHLTAHPPFDNKPRGVFATRSPHRPNLIGMTVVNLHSREENILKISGIDMIEGTPVLDIKPYTPRDQKKDIRLGWITPVIDKTTETKIQRD
jgi:tRNA-Thr(GGU) m(6)t(6)A37 methyltransferase TsaA